MAPYYLLSSISLYINGTKNEIEKQKRTKFLLKSMSTSSSINIENELLSQLYNDYEINIVNRFYLSQNIVELNKDFVNLLECFRKIEFIDYNDVNSSMKRINDSMEILTDFKIKNILNENFLNNARSLLLVNCCFFQGLWASSFSKVSTTRENFYLKNGSIKYVDMMLKRHMKLKYINDFKYLNASVCELPYLDKHLSMTIILPNESTSIDSIEMLLSIDVLKIIFEMNKCFFKVNVLIPKFKLEQSLEVSAIENKFKIHQIFQLIDF